MVNEKQATLPRMEKREREKEEKLLLIGKTFISQDCASTYHLVLFSVLY